MISATVRLKETGRHVTAQVAIGHDAHELPILADDAEAPEAFLGHHHKRAAHSLGDGNKGKSVAAMHDIADMLQVRAELPTRMKDFEVERRKARPSRSAIARQSPSASCISVDVVGASPCGHASFTCGSARTTSAALPSVLSAPGGHGDERHAETARIGQDIGKLCASRPTRTARG